jgi:hypothetical protein
LALWCANVSLTRFRTAMQPQSTAESGTPIRNFGERYFRGYWARSDKIEKNERQL